MNEFLGIIQHPIEGCAYLIYIGLFLRWRHPKSWNKLLDGLAVKSDYSSISTFFKKEDIKA